MNITQTQADRRRAFRKALLDEGLTASSFAREHVRITPQHLWRAFTNPDGVRQHIHDAIDAMITKHSPAHADL